MADLSHRFVAQCYGRGFTSTDELHAGLPGTSLGVIDKTVLRAWLQGKLEASLMATRLLGGPVQTISNIRRRMPT